MNVTAPGETERQPTCADWQRLAARRWRRQARIRGCGPLAVISYCPGGITVSLWDDEVEAVAALDRLDRIRCGARCVRDHHIVDLEEVAA